MTFTLCVGRKNSQGPKWLQQLIHIGTTSDNVLALPMLWQESVDSDRTFPVSAGRKNGQDAKWLQHSIHIGTTSDKVLALTLLLQESVDCDMTFSLSAGRKNGQDAKWLQQVRRSGTTSDKVAALTLLLQENAVANLRSLDALLTWVLKRKGGRNVVAQVPPQLFLPDDPPPLNAL